MEEYVNEDSVIKNSQYEAFKEYIYCQKCECLMIEPVLCLNCQNKFCKKCAEECENKNGKCPLNCEKTSLRKVIGKNNMISKIKFKCIKGCGAEIPFDDINNHYNSNCIENKKNEEKIEKGNITILTKKETEEKTKEGQKLDRMASKIN